MTPAEMITHANGDTPLPVPALEAAAFILHLIEHDYTDDQAEAAYEHWSGYPEKIRQQGRDDAARVLRAAMGAAGLVVVPAEDVIAALAHPGGLTEPGSFTAHVVARDALLTAARAALPERTPDA